MYNYIHKNNFFQELTNLSKNIIHSYKEELFFDKFEILKIGDNKIESKKTL